MRKLKSVLLYTALALVANGASADPANIADLRTGDMTKLVVHSAERAVKPAEFLNEGGGKTTLADYEGKVLAVNLWATWCAPCREEMPSLSALQSAFDASEFEVLTIATGPNPEPAMDRFFDEIAVTNLPRHRDPKQKFARAMAVIGLPVTILIDRDGNEVARLQGDADWNSESARAIVAALIDED